MSVLKNIGKIYALLVILISVMVVTTLSGSILNQTIKIYFPEYTSGYNSLITYNDNDSYKKLRYEKLSDSDIRKKEILEKMTDAEWTDARLKDRELKLRENDVAAKGSILESIPYLFVFLITLLVHIFVYRRFDRKEFN